MFEREVINTIMHELQIELEHQNDFIEKLKGINKELDIKGSPPLYALQQLIATGEQNTSAIRKAMAELPLEDWDE